MCGFIDSLLYVDAFKSTYSPMCLLSRLFGLSVAYPFCCLLSQETAAVGLPINDFNKCCLIGHFFLEKVPHPAKKGNSLDSPSGNLQMGQITKINLFENKFYIALWLQKVSPETQAAIHMAASELLSVGW